MLIHLCTACTAKNVCALNDIHTAINRAVTVPLNPFSVRFYSVSNKNCSLSSVRFLVTNLPL